MAYYVYENWTIDKAIVHNSNCAFCRNGYGLHGTGKTKNSTWHGPFESSADAFTKAKACKRARTDRCSVCSPL